MDYYKKYDYWFMALGFVCLLLFLAVVFSDPKHNNTCTTTTQVIDKKTVKETLDDISQKLDIIRQELQVLETREKGLSSESR